MKEIDPTPALPDLVFHVLLALGHGPSHGYAIGQDVEEQSGGRLDPTTGALYQVLRRLTDEGLRCPGGRPWRCRSATQVLRIDEDWTPRRGTGSRAPGRARAGGTTAQALSAASLGMRMYRWLLRLSPEALRREYGAAMEEMFARRLAEARRRSAGYVAHVWGARARRPARARRLRAIRRSGTTRVTRQQQRLSCIEGRNHGCDDAGDLAGGTAARANASVHAHGSAHAGPCDCRQRVDLHRREPRRREPAALSAVRSADRSRLWHAGTERRFRYELDGVAAVFPPCRPRANATARGGLRHRRGYAHRWRESPSGFRSHVPHRRSRPSSACSRRSGRWFIEPEGVSGAAPVAVLSHGLWVRRFGADRSIVGRSITFDGVPTEVVGVMPATFSFPDSRTDMWMPAQSTRANASFLFNLAGVARLQDGASVESARTEITSLIADLSRIVPNQRGLVSAAIPLQESLVGRIARALWTLMAAVAIVLLVACANVANLFLVRSETRQREVAIRRALGAGRRSLARYFFAESALLSLIGGVLGFVLAWAGIQLLVAFGPASLPRLDEVRLDIVTVAFTIGLTIVATAVFGVIPVLRLAPVAPTLHENGRSQSPTRGSHRARQFLMGAQVALALVLLVASGLMVRSFQKLRAVDPGFNPTSTLTFSIGLPQTKYQTRAGRRRCPYQHPRAAVGAPWCSRRIGDDVPAACGRVLRERAACRW